MFMPPFPDSRMGYMVEIRTAEATTFGAWTELQVFGPMEGNARKFQFRVTLSREAASYQSSLAGFHSTYPS